VVDTALAKIPIPEIRISDTEVFEYFGIRNTYSNTWLVPSGLLGGSEYSLAEASYEGS